MTVVLAFLGIAIIVLCLLLALQKQEIKSISKQLARISKQDSNETIHAEYGGFSGELINEINALLKEMRHSEILYRQKSHRLEQMITNISHDLRTPLTSAMGYVNIVLNSDLPPEEKKKQICIVEQRLQQLEELINAFFEFSVLISGEQSPEREDINLIEVLQEAIVHYYDDYCAVRREIHLVFDGMEDGTQNSKQLRLTVYSNRNLLMRIFDNLIGNAYKHGEGNLTVRLGQSEHINICFENRLCGSDVDISRIFDEFYTTDISRTKGNTGLGLAIAKQFVQMLEGDIRAEYEEGVFRVRIRFNI